MDASVSCRLSPAMTAIKFNVERMIMMMMVMRRMFLSLKTPLIQSHLLPATESEV